MSLSNPDLKRRYESGGKLNQPLKTRVTKELKRVCKFRECDKSMAFESPRKEFCCYSHKVKERIRLRRANLIKKRRYNIRHGLVRKTIKKNVEIHTPNFLPVDTPVVYEDYKEPLKKIEKGQGFGFYGTIALSEDRNYVQCHICGNLFQALSAHIPAHKLTVAQYKEDFGLATTTALLGEETRATRQANAVKRFDEMYDGKIPELLAKYNREGQPGNKGTKGRKWSLEQRNKLGVCPDQLLEKIKAMEPKLGRLPSSDEFEREYNGRYRGSIAFVFGSWTDAIHKLGEKTMGELKAPDDLSLLQDLADFFKNHGRIPMSSDFSRGLLHSRTTYNQHFGSLNEARVSAGLNAVIPMPFGQIIEVTPEQYREYKNGHADFLSPRTNKRRLARRAKRELSRK